MKMMVAEAAYREALSGGMAPFDAALAGLEAVKIPTDGIRQQVAAGGDIDWSRVPVDMPPQKSKVTVRDYIMAAIGYDAVSVIETSAVIVGAREGAAAQRRMMALAGHHFEVGTSTGIQAPTPDPAITIIAAPIILGISHAVTLQAAGLIQAGARRLAASEKSKIHA